jgi:hypothetical protein
MASVLGETLGPSNGFRHAIKGRMRRGRVRTTKAGARYAIIVFLIGFILGTIRILLLVPRVRRLPSAWKHR